MGLINILFDLCFLVLLVRAIVPNEGHMAFNRPYQIIISVLEPLWKKLKAPDRQTGQLCWLILIVLIGLRGILWSIFGTNVLDFKVIVISASRANLIQSQVLSVMAALVFLLQVYAFITLAIAIGRLENRTDHFSRLMRGLLGPSKKVPPWGRFGLVAVALTLFWMGALWAMSVLGVAPAPQHGEMGYGIGAALISFALLVDLARVWVALIVVRSVFSFVPMLRSPVVDVIERITEPLIKPFRSLHLKAGQFDLTPLAAIVVLLLLHHALLSFTPFDRGPVLKWLFQQS